jgi:HlyD family secretion protein
MTAARRNRYILWGGLVAVLLIALLFAFSPRPVAADFAEISRGPMTTSIDEEGETRIRDVFSVSAPVGGDLIRISLEPGDFVVAGETVVAELRPADPAFLTSRTTAELQAAVTAAQAAVDVAEADLSRAAAERELSQSDLERARDLRANDTISERALQLAEIDLRASEAAFAGAAAALDMRRAELARAQAALIEPGSDTGATAHGCCISVTAPSSGRVLRVLRKSGGPVAAGEPLVELGDPADLEVVADLLSTDAVQVSAGDRVVIAEWGGDEELQGRVRLVEPYGFTKISALGIEEQRVNVVIDFDSPAEAWRRLGHGFRVEARVVTWSADDVVTAPLAALFREGDAWAAFVIRGGRARLTVVQVGHRNSRRAEILAGLEPGDQVLLHPAAEIVDGTSVRRRSLEPAPAAEALPLRREPDAPPLAESEADGRSGG